jgi:cell division cycle 14
MCVHTGLATPERGALQLRATKGGRAFALAAPGAAAGSSLQLLPILDGVLYLRVAATPPQAEDGTNFMMLNRQLQYVPFCADFGPLCLGTSSQVVKHLRKLLQDLPAGGRIVYCSTQAAADITNSIWVLGAFLCLCLGATPDQALAPFAALERGLLVPFRDATWVKSSFDLTVRDCWAGLLKAVDAGLFDLDSFSESEYFKYDDPTRYDMHVVVRGKFIAFRGPRSKRLPLANGGTTLCAADYVDAFSALGVAAVVRLNEPEYEAGDFRVHGIAHYDMVFRDCSTPSDAVVDQFLRIAEAEQGLVAVHCLAGLGRTGTLIGLWMMKHLAFSGREAIAWLRICRPGSVIGPQQAYLVKQETRMHSLRGVPGLGSSMQALAEASLIDSPRLGPGAAPRDSSCNKLRSNVGSHRQSEILANMVTAGMLNRGKVCANLRVLDDKIPSPRITQPTHTPSKQPASGHAAHTHPQQPAPTVTPRRKGALHLPRLTVPPAQSCANSARTRSGGTTGTVKVTTAAVPPDDDCCGASRNPTPLSRNKARPSFNSVREPDKVRHDAGPQSPLPSPPSGAAQNQAPVTARMARFKPREANGLRPMKPRVARSDTF